MIEVRQTEAFVQWLADLKDGVARKAIGRRLARIELGLMGDWKPVGEGVSELRFDLGPGYRVYFTQRGQVLVILLCGGDKGSQARDIARARAMLAELE
ncbi:MAG: type II toxin-antitoxin system RelE/ParE family toxin [Sandarakinorhabdus sp.]